MILSQPEYYSAYIMQLLHRLNISVLHCRLNAIADMGVKLIPYSLFLIRKGIRNEKYMSFLIPYLTTNNE